MIDIDEWDRINRAGDRYGHITPGVVAELIAEVRAWRNEAVAHQAFVDAFNASTDSEETYGRWESAIAASLPYRQAAIDAARKEKA